MKKQGNLWTEKGPVGFSTLSKGPIAINRLRTPSLADCRVNTCSTKETGFVNKQTVF